MKYCAMSGATLGIWMVAFMAIKATGYDHPITAAVVVTYLLWRK